MRGEVFMPKRLSYREIKDVVETAGYELISEEYINSTTPIVVKCKQNHDPYKVKYSNFQSGRRCPACAIIKRNESKRLNPPDVRKKVEDAGYNLLEIKEGYKGEHKKLVVSCDKGHDAYEVSYQNFNKGRRCPHCKREKRRIPLHEIRGAVEKEGFEIISGEYLSRKSKMIYKCPQGHVYPSTYDSFLAGKRCGKCSGSRGENLINFILSTILINDTYTYQYRVDIGGTTYRYDFCIKTSNHALFIEYDGIQHYRPVSRFGGEEGFKDQKANDAVKDAYVLETTDSELLRVPYFLSYENAYREVVTFLRSHNVQVKEITDMSLLAKAAHTSQDRVRLIAEYFLTHSLADTIEQFSVHRATVYKYFKTFFGTNKESFLATE
jgi:predicted Zn-ribbon and HTH transcriptional regulator